MLYSDIRESAQRNGNSTQSFKVGAPTTSSEAMTPNQLVGFKNFIINGGFDVWQRGTDAVDDYGYKSADRWVQYGCMIEKDVDVLGKPFAKCTCRDEDRVNEINQRIENARQFSNKTVTVSFEIDSPDGLTDGNIYVYTKDNDDNVVIFLDTDFQYTDTRTRYSFTLNLDNTLLKEDESLKCYIRGDRTDTNQNGKVFNVYNVQLEEGSVATPFEMRPYGLELSLCQRYYEKLVGEATISVAGQYSSTSVRGSLKYTPKYKEPDFVIDNAALNFVYNSDAIASTDISFPIVTKEYAEISATVDDTTDLYPGLLRLRDTFTLEINSEL